MIENTGPIHAEHREQGSRCFIGLSSVHWREAWKYGERAFRYCRLDVGHALGALRYAAGTLGWEIRLMEKLAGDESTAAWVRETYPLPAQPGDRPAAALILKRRIAQRFDAKTFMAQEDFYRILGITGKSFQSVYHFTVGQPLLDDRILTRPPYPDRDADTAQ